MWNRVVAAGEGVRRFLGLSLMVREGLGVVVAARSKEGVSWRRSGRRLVPMETHIHA